jgi:hypothetical protein
VRFTAELLLAALGTGESDDDEQHAYAVAGAMALAEGLLELTRLRKLIAKALSNR